MYKSKSNASYHCRISLSCYLDDIQPEDTIIDHRRDDDENRDYRLLVWNTASYEQDNDCEEYCFNTSRTVFRSLIRTANLRPQPSPWSKTNLESRWTVTFGRILGTGSREKWWLLEWRDEKVRPGMYTLLRCLRESSTLCCMLSVILYEKKNIAEEYQNE